MARFSRSSAAHLAECHGDLQVLFNEVIVHTDCKVLDGERPKAEQNEAKRKGWSKVSWPNSNHNVDGVKRTTSWAADVGPYFVDVRNGIDWKDIPAFALFAGKVLETARRLKAEGRMTYEVRWGGDWDGDGRTKDHRFFDGPHFELVGVPDGE